MSEEVYGPSARSGSSRAAAALPERIQELDRSGRLLEAGTELQNCWGMRAASCFHYERGQHI